MTLKALRNSYVGFCAIFLGYLWWVTTIGWTPSTTMGAVAFVAVQLGFGYAFYSKTR
jgi:hypothetical protein